MPSERHASLAQTRLLDFAIEAAKESLNRNVEYNVEYYPGCATRGDRQGDLIVFAPVRKWEGDEIWVELVPSVGAIPVRAATQPSSDATGHGASRTVLQGATSRITTSSATSGGRRTPTGRMAEGAINRLILHRLRPKGKLGIIQEMNRDEAADFDAVLRETDINWQELGERGLELAAEYEVECTLDGGGTMTLGLSLKYDGGSIVGEGFVADLDSEMAANFMRALRLR